MGALEPKSIILTNSEVLLVFNLKLAGFKSRWMILWLIKKLMPRQRSANAKILDL